MGVDGPGRQMTVGGAGAGQGQLPCNGIGCGLLGARRCPFLVRVGEVPASLSPFHVLGP